VVIVNETDPGLGCTNYTLRVTGFECPQRIEIAADPSSVNRVLVKWSTSGVGYNLLSSPTVTPPGSYLPAGPPPVVIDGKYTVTNTTSGNSRFYELRKP
jgi:hypothetical protein